MHPCGPVVADGAARSDEARQVGEQGVPVAVEMRPDALCVTLERVMGHGGALPARERQDPGAHSDHARMMVRSHPSSDQ
jgi:hypothetical protein